MQKIDLNRHIWEGWTVGDFILYIEPAFDQIMQRRSHVQPFKDDKELKEWCMSEQPYYKKNIPEVFKYFKNKFASLA